MPLRIGTKASGCFVRATALALPTQLATRRSNWCCRTFCVVGGSSRDVSLAVNAVVTSRPFAISGDLFPQGPASTKAHDSLFPVGAHLSGKTRQQPFPSLARRLVSNTYGPRSSRRLLCTCAPRVDRQAERPAHHHRQQCIDGRA